MTSCILRPAQARTNILETNGNYHGVPWVAPNTPDSEVKIKRQNHRLERSFLVVVTIPSHTEIAANGLIITLPIAFACFGKNASIVRQSETSQLSSSLHLTWCYSKLLNDLLLLDITMFLFDYIIFPWWMSYRHIWCFKLQPGAANFFVSGTRWSHPHSTGNSPQSWRPSQAMRYLKNGVYLWMVCR